MYHGKRIRTALGAVAAAMLFVALIAPVGTMAAGAHGKGGNSAAAHACQHGGWKNLKRADGTRFKNQGKCVSYAAHRGTLVSLAPSVTVSYAPTSDTNYCLVIVGLADLAPSTTYSGVVTIRSFGSVFSPYPSDITTDTNGNASTAVFSYLQGYYDNSADADYAGLSSGYSLISC
jgi:hypothetical protein